LVVEYLVVSDHGTGDSANRRTLAHDLQWIPRLRKLATTDGLMAAVRVWRVFP